MKIEDILNKEIPIKWNLMLYQLFKDNKGFLIVQETEKSFDLTFKIPLPKTKQHRDGVNKVLKEVWRWKGE